MKGGFESQSNQPRIICPWSPIVPVNYDHYDPFYEREKEYGGLTESLQMMKFQVPKQNRKRMRNQEKARKTTRVGKSRENTPFSCSPKIHNHMLHCSLQAQTYTG